MGSADVRSHGFARRNHDFGGNIFPGIFIVTARVALGDTKYTLPIKKDEMIGKVCQWWLEQKYAIVHLASMSGMAPTLDLL